MCSWGNQWDETEKKWNILMGDLTLRSSTDSEKSSQKNARKKDTSHNVIVTRKFW